MITKTPGIWEEIPKDSIITATRKDVVLKGKFGGIRTIEGHKVLTIEVPPIGTLRLDARDHWDVEYHSESMGDFIQSAPIGAVIRNSKNDIECVKVTEDHFTMRSSASGYWTTPRVWEISEVDSYMEVPASDYRIIT